MPGVDGDLSWLEGYTTTGLLEYEDFSRTVDVLVMGRKTYETVLPFTGWPYGKLPLVVLSRQPRRFPPSPQATVSQLAGEPPDIIKALAVNYSHAYGGSNDAAFYCCRLSG